jgi:hypothetical protein
MDEGIAGIGLTLRGGAIPCTTPPRTLRALHLPLSGHHRLANLPNLAKLPAGSGVVGSPLSRNALHKTIPDPGGARP